jgi:hypothetical protein
VGSQSWYGLQFLQKGLLFLILSFLVDEIFLMFPFFLRLGFGQQLGMGARPMAPILGMRPPVPVNAPQPDAAMANNQQMSGAPVLEDSFLNQHEGGEQNSANSMTQDGTASEKKASCSALLIHTPKYCLNWILFFFWILLEPF